MKLALTYSTAVLFAQMKSEVNEMIQRFGQENPPPPAQVFTIKNVPGDGNIHLIQKVFKGAFEVLFTVYSSVHGLQFPVRYPVQFWVFSRSRDV